MLHYHICVQKMHHQLLLTFHFCVCVHVKAHPSKEYFVVAEKGKQPDIIVYEYPSLRPFCILRGMWDPDALRYTFLKRDVLSLIVSQPSVCVGGTERAYSFVDFNPDGSLLASVGGAPDYMLTLWDWRKEKVLLSCKAVSQEVYRVSFSPYNPGMLTSSGSGHIK